MGRTRGPAVRLLCIFAAVSATAWAQFYGLATPSDGSAVYFTTSLRLKGALESPWGKVFAADEHGVRLVAQRWLRKPPTPGNYASNCVIGQLNSFGAVELSADASTLAALGFRWTAGQCHGAGAATMLRTKSGTRDIDGYLRISANGQWAVVDATSSVFSQTAVSILNLKTGERKDLQFNSPGGVQFPSGRAIADDGTALFSGFGGTYIVRPGSAPATFAQGFPVAISASGTRVLYQTDTVHLIDLPTQNDQQLSAAGTRAVGIGLSDDGNRAAFLQDGDLCIADFGGPARQIGAVPEGLSQPVLSGDGRTLYAATSTGRLVKIAVETGLVTEIIGRTVDVATATSVDAGMFYTIVGRGFAEQSFTASAPLPVSLGGVSVSVGGRLVPISRVTPNAIDVLIPWDMTGALPLVVNAPAPNTPFATPQTTLGAGIAVRAGALYRQGWAPLTDLTVHAGEIIHVYAVGLGPVAPEVPPGTAAPSTEPLSRITTPFSCSNADVLYAGLQPGAVARIYQVDLKIGAKTGYQMFNCWLGESNFGFLTLNVVP